MFSTSLTSSTPIKQGSIIPLTHTDTHTHTSQWTHNNYKPLFFHCCSLCVASTSCGEPTVLYFFTGSLKMYLTVCCIKINPYICAAKYVKAQVLSEPLVVFGFDPLLGIIAHLETHYNSALTTRERIRRCYFFVSCCLLLSLLYNVLC